MSSLVEIEPVVLKKKITTVVDVVSLSCNTMHPFEIDDALYLKKYIYTGMQDMIIFFEPPPFCSFTGISSKC